jgi:serine/threonine protein phosphatase PrpC
MEIGSVVTVASVGDSRCVLEAEGSIYYLPADYRFDANERSKTAFSWCTVVL